MAIGISSHLEYWEHRIARDTAPFIDPGTTLDIRREGRVVRVSWLQRSLPRDATFTISLDAGAQVMFRGQNLSYRSLFAAPEMGDLLNLAKMIQQSQRPSIYVPTRARRGDTQKDRPADAIQVLRAAMADAATEDATLVVMVTGDAGAGKTSVLRRLVARQAEEYAKGATECLYLYVNAQGRALARFNEALATELQDLRATLTYHGVSTLVRLGILVPVIDGFDELLGVGGYEDAFSSLAAFIEELDGSGQLIASARSTYYEQEFVARANRVSALGAQVWKQIPIEVLAWGDPEVQSYLDQRCAAATLSHAQSEVVQTRVRQVFRGPNEALRHKPLFVARTMDLVLSNVDLTGEGDLLQQLVTGYLERDRTEKLLSRSGEALLTSEQLAGLLGELAEEMWNQETRELDGRSVREVAEYVAGTTDLEEDVRRVVIERMSSMAFLTPGSRAGGIAFEHETFFAYFLAHRFARSLALSSEFPPLLLGRSVLPADLPGIVIRVLSERYPDVKLTEALDRLGRAGEVTNSRSVQIRENAGALVSTLLKAYCDARQSCTGIRIRNVVIPGGDWAGVCVTRALLEDVEFRRVDLSRTRLIECKARNVLLIEPLLDRSTSRLELAGLSAGAHVLGLRAVLNDEVRLVYEPDLIDEYLAAVGAAPVARTGASSVRLVEPDVVELVRRFARAYNRSNPVCTSDDVLHHVFSHQDWSVIERLLVETGVVTTEVRSTGGPRKTFLRRQVLAEEILNGLRRDADVPSSVERFWTALENRFPDRRHLRAGA